MRVSVRRRRNSLRPSCRSENSEDEHSRARGKPRISASHRRVRLGHVNSSVKRYHMVHETSRPRQAGVRDRVTEVCCALHNFRVRLTPWPPMV